MTDKLHPLHLRNLTEIKHDIDSAIDAFFQQEVDRRSPESAKQRINEMLLRIEGWARGSRLALLDRPFSGPLTLPSDVETAPDLFQEPR